MVREHDNNCPPGEHHQPQQAKTRLGEEQVASAMEVAEFIHYSDIFERDHQVHLHAERCSEQSAVTATTSSPTLSPSPQPEEGVYTY
jgi:hypothetical protein